MIPEPVRVLHRRKEVAGTWTLDLAPGNSGQRLFAPGQFNMLYVFGVGEIPISISGDAATPQSQVHTIRDVGPVSRALAALKPGDTVGLRGPFGTGWPVTAAEGGDVVLVAGGLGLAPLRPAIYHVLGHRERYRQVVLVYGTRSPQEILFLKELDAWSRRGDMQVHVTVDHAGTDWMGNVGVVTNLIPAATFDANDTVAMVCGPELMMRFTAAALADRGVADEAIHLSMERNMKCAIGLCGHCQFGPTFICKDGPVLSHDRIRDLLNRKEI